MADHFEQQVKHHLAQAKALITVYNQIRLASNGDPKEAEEAVANLTKKVEETSCPTRTF